MKRNNDYCKVILTMLLVVACHSPRKATFSYSGLTETTVVNTEKVLLPAVPDSIQIKYASLLNVEPDSINNFRLYRFIDRWFAVRYKWGGTTERGIDCSAFLQRLIREVYAIEIPRTSFEQLNAQSFEVIRSRKFLIEGDILFFRTRPNTIVSHVGFYLTNSMFVNCSSSQGVSLASLQDPYWKKRYVAARQIRFSDAQKAAGKSLANKK